MSFFKKALGVFVEIDETPTDNTIKKEVNVTNNNVNNNLPKTALNQLDIEKFEKHFDKLFEQANMPGPDYYEFCKVQATLEAHIQDEKARFAAAFASLSVQGLTKQKLLEAAAYYKEVIVADKLKFEKALDQKSHTDLETKKSSVSDMDKRIVDNSELIKKLTKEITDAQDKIAKLKEEIAEEEKRLSSNKTGYNIACEAMLNKINQDILKIQSNL
jgi:hypothetical protein